VISCDKQELHRRIESPDSFDGGNTTAAWLADLGSAAKWIGIKDFVSGHEIHCVSDRQVPQHELLLGLRLMIWMTRGLSAFRKPIRWFWWDQPLPRILPAATEPGRDHVNGGWAVVGIPEVHVYRREEAHKVLLHECIHALELDVSQEAATKARQQFEMALGKHLWPHLGEAWTEFQAELLWAVASSKSRADAGTAWINQKACAAKQAAQIWARIRKSYKAEDTNVFAYYILKWVLMAHEATVFFAPDASVPYWFHWWQSQLPVLEAAAAKIDDTDTDIPIGMTCYTSRTILSNP